MPLQLNELVVYELQHRCVNHPAAFLNETERLPVRYRSIPRELIDILRAKALLVSGSIPQAQDLLTSLEQLVSASGIPFLQAKYLLLRYQALSFTGDDDELAQRSITDARSLVEETDSQGLHSEYKALLAIQANNGMEIEEREELLRSAIHAALEADIPALQLEAQYDYSIAYLTHNLPEPASRALAILGEMLDPQRDPYLHTASHINQGIVKLMLNDPTGAQTILQSGCAMADRHHFANLHIPMLLNLGVSLANSGNAEQGILTYRKCLNLIKQLKLENSPNAGKAQDNLARALGKCGRVRDAVDTSRAALNEALARGNMLRANIQRVNLADYLIDLEAQDEASTLLDEAIAWFGSTGQSYYLTFAYRCRARLHESLGQYEQAFEAMELLDRENQQHFRENFSKQRKVFQERLERLRTQYVLIRDNCAPETDRMLSGSGHSLIGEHPSIKKAIHDALLAAHHPYTNVFVTGESGTGKEIIARIIHAESKIGKPLVAINASAISPNLIESERSATNAVLSPVPQKTARVSLCWPTKVPCCWMKSQICLWIARPSCCAPSKPMPSIPLAVTGKYLCTAE